MIENQDILQKLFQIYYEKRYGVKVNRKVSADCRM